jgi:hypothetical protein
VISNATLPQGMRVKSIEATDSLVLVSSWEHGVWMLPLRQLYPPKVATGDARDVTATTATYPAHPHTVVRSAGLGLHPRARPGADDYDLELPPALDETPSLRFLSESPAPLRQSILPPGGPGQSWEFTVTGVPNGQPVVLTWQPKVEPGQALWLHNLTTERKADMLAPGNYAFRATGGSGSTTGRRPTSASTSSPSGTW